MAFFVHLAGHVIVGDKDVKSPAAIRAIMKSAPVRAFQAPAGFSPRQRGHAGEVKPGITDAQ